jgi:hypothetical protein
VANPGGVFPIMNLVRLRSFAQSPKRGFNLKTALLAALPIEIVNFWVVGYPAGSNGLISASQNAAIALQWYLLHLPGVIASDRSIFLRTHPGACSIVLFIAGFIDTTILLALAIWAARLALRTLSKLSSPMKAAH